MRSGGVEPVKSIQYLRAGPPQESVAFHQYGFGAITGCCNRRCGSGRAGSNHDHVSIPDGFNFPGVCIHLVFLSLPDQMLNYWAVQPPSTDSTTPVINRDSSLPRNTAAEATSSTLPSGPRGC